MYASVLIQYGAKSLDKVFTYHIPDNLVDKISVGMRVSVPFNKKNINGFVMSIESKCESDYEILDIIDVVNESFKLNDELIHLGEYLKEKTLCTLISAYQTMLPTSLKINKSKFDYTMYNTYIEIDDIDKCKYFIEHEKRSLKQIEVVNRLMSVGRIKKSEIGSQIMNALIKKELVKEVKENVYRINPMKSNIGEVSLTDEQNEAFKSVLSSFGSHNVFLLHGVTGSGKTEVYIKLVKETLLRHKNVIMLVPEITLTTQIVKRFYDVFGAEVAVIHSSLSDGEKSDEYKKILKNEAHIVVGTRSSIFVPLKDIGLIIIDEEHTSSYKQETNPRYNAIDMAIFRGKYHNCPVVLGSATPRLETMARAKKGVYKYLSLKNRVGSATLPKVEIVDLASSYKNGDSIISTDLQLKIMNRLDNHEQVMLLINRRGYSTIITCASCGYTYKCPHCDITLTYHKSSNNLRCHYCGYTKFMSDICPECHEKAIKTYGYGTEQIEKCIRELYPNYNIVRMDTDTTSKKGASEKIIKDIEECKYDIIIGTQMIAKGLNFPKVTLVGVINADESLNIPDFRSGENTFNLLQQVSGRAGRSSSNGEVVIQTFNPTNKTLNYVKNNDYFGNYEYEMNIRKMLKYPPYYYLTSIKVISKDYNKASIEANKLVNFLKRNLDKTTIVLGPTTASVFKVNNNYRFQILIKYRVDNRLNDVLRSVDLEYAFNKDIYLEIDMDPIRI